MKLVIISLLFFYSFVIFAEYDAADNGVTGTQAEHDEIYPEFTKRKAEWETAWTRFLDVAGRWEEASIDSHTDKETSEETKNLDIELAEALSELNRTETAYKEVADRYKKIWLKLQEEKAEQEDH